MSLFQQINETVNFIQSKTDFQAEIGIILGTGLGDLANEIDQVAVMNYADLPHFPVSTVESHKGELVFGYLAGRKVVAMSGRFHYYEGYSMQQVTFPVRVLKGLGVQRLIVSNAVGSTHPDYEAGDLVFVKDHINFHVENPLRGENDERIGPRFPDMMFTYDRQLNAKALALAQAHHIRAHEGVYFGWQGPNLETPAEYKFIHLLGADVVGMSTIPEVLVAKHMDLPVFVLSVVSNKCFPIEALTPTTLEEVIAVVQQAAPKMSWIVKELLKEM
ncbi:MAG: purine-nucleoside phosphorylase [Saprospiraceae bacterium]|nr:purine-nucleoside phosphorylase [Saprospiraceae bacterium]